MPDTLDGFVDALQDLFADVGFVDAPSGLEAARLWSYLRTNTPAEARAFTLEAAVDAGSSSAWTPTPWGGRSTPYAALNSSPGRWRGSSR